MPQRFVVRCVSALTTAAVLAGLASAPVTGTVANNPPDAVDDTFRVAPKFGPRDLVVLGNDTTAPDTGEELSIVAITLPLHGTVQSYYANTTLRYEPYLGYLGPDSLTYTVSDGNGGTDTATVSIDVTPDVTGPITVKPWARIWSDELGTSSVHTRLFWSAVDDMTSVTAYQLQMSVNGSTFSTVKLAKPLTARYVSDLRANKTYQFRARARDWAGNWGSWAVADPLTVKIFQESTGLATYQGAWSKSAQANASGGATYRSSQTGATVDFTFNGRAVATVVTMTPSSGRVRVYIDGVYRFTWRLRSATNMWRRILSGWYWHSTGPHTVKLILDGGGRVDVDGFIVFR